MKPMDVDVTGPLFFAPNRVWRCHPGGKLLDRFVGSGTEADVYLPEEWLASTVRAVNRENSLGPDEGLARVLAADGTAGPLFIDILKSAAEETLGPRHTARYGHEPALLCKYLDSSVRLPIQCHPDRETARKVFGSQFGKTECWHILDTRQIDGQEAYLLMGFKPGVTAEAFAKVTETQDIPAMEAMLHKILPRPGETYFVPARMPHAIGPGVFLIEVQEPSDWVVVPERYCAGIRLSDQHMWCSLTQEKGLAIFDYTTVAMPELLSKVLVAERPMPGQEGGELFEAIGLDQTSSFSLLRASITGRMTVRLPRAFGVIVVTGGRGQMRWQGGKRDIRRGEYFFQPASVGWIEYTAEEPISLAICLPPEAPKKG